MQLYLAPVRYFCARPSSARTSWRVRPAAGVGRSLGCSPSRPYHWKKKIINLARTTLFRICRGFPMLKKGAVRVQSNHSTTGTKSIIMIILIIITINNTWRCWSTQPFDRQATATGSWIYPPRQPLRQNWKKYFFKISNPFVLVGSKGRKIISARERKSKR